MGAEIAAVTARLDSDTKGFDAGMDRAAEKLSGVEAQVKETEDAIAQLGEGGVEAMSSLQDAVNEFAEKFALASLAVAGFEKAIEVMKDLAKEIINNAAAAEQIQVQFQSAFGASAAEVGEWAEKTGGALGRSQDDMEKLATSARVMVGGLGATGETADHMAESLAKMATQMSIARGIPLEQAMQSLNAGIHGAGRGLYEYGIALNASTQAAEMAREGLDGQFSALTQTQQAQVNFNIIQAAAGKVASDAAAATGTFTNQVASLHSSWEEMTAHLGADALPALTSTVSAINDLVKGFDSLSGSTKGWILALATGPIGLQIKALSELVSEAKALVGGGGGPPAVSSNPASQKADAEAIRARQERLKEIDDAEAARLAAAKKLADFNREADLEEAEGDQQRYQDAMRALQQHAAEVAKIDAKKLKDLHDLISEEQKADADRVKAQEFAAALVRSNDAEHIASTQAAVDDAKKRLDELQKDGGSFADIVAAQSAVESAYGMVQAASAQAMQDLQKQIDANNAAIAADELSVGRDQDIERLKKDNMELQKQLNKDGLDLTKEQREAFEFAAKQAKAIHDAWASLASSALNSFGGGAITSAISGAESMKAAGPAGMAAGAGVAILGQSQGGKDVAAAASKLLQEVSDAIGQLLEPLVPVIQELATALAPLIKALGDVFGAAGRNLATTLQALMPVITEVSDLLASILEPIAQLIASVQPLIPIVIQISEVMLAIENIGLAPFLIALKLLGPAIGLVAKAADVLVDGIITVWNGIVDAVASLLDALAHALPSAAGDAMRQLWFAVEGMKGSTVEQIQAGETLTATLKSLQEAAADGTLSTLALSAAQRDSVMQQAATLHELATEMRGIGAGTYADTLDAQANALTSELSQTAQAAAAATQSVQQFSDALQQAQGKVKGDKDQVDADKVALANAEANGLSKAVTDALAQTLAQDQAQETVDAYMADAQAAKDNGDYNRYIEYLALAAEAQAENTSASDSNTAATQALTASLTNVPAMFKVAQAVDQVTSAMGGSSGGGSKFPGVTGSSRGEGAMGERITKLLGSVAGGTTYSGVVINGDVHVDADSDDIFDAIKKKLGREKVTRTGSSPRDLMSRHALVGQG